MTALPLETADRIAEECLRVGSAAGYGPLTVAVLDAGGHTIVLKRSDGSGILRADIAFGKAWGALGMGLSSRALAKRSAAAPIFYSSLAAVSAGRLIPVPGGVLVKTEDGSVVGAVGVSGDTSDHDEDCAVQAIRSVNLIPDIEER
jgi:uncharacterized protein GlcG (DUF336 family)